MSTKLFVGGLPWAMDTQRLKEVFAEFGDLVDARVITDRETGRSRGFGFVTMGSDELAQKAIQEKNGAMLDGRPLRVNEAQERPARGGGGAGGGGGGRGGDRRGGGGGHRGW